MLWELEASPVRGFFESVGGRVVGERPIRLGDAEYPGVGYGWDDLGVLASQAD